MGCYPTSLFSARPFPRVTGSARSQLRSSSHGFHQTIATVDILAKFTGVADSARLVCAGCVFVVFKLLAALKWISLLDTVI